MLLRYGSVLWGIPSKKVFIESPNSLGLGYPMLKYVTRKAELKSEGVVALLPRLCLRSGNEIVVALPLLLRLGIQVSTRLIWGIMISSSGIMRCLVLLNLKESSIPMGMRRLSSIRLEKG